MELDCHLDLTLGRVYALQHYARRCALAGPFRKRSRAVPDAPSLQSLLQRAQPGQPYNEVEDMQPRLVAGLRAAARALQSDLTLFDTHARGLLNPNAKIDCSCMAAPCKAWSQLVQPMEFKLQDSDEPSLIGEVVRRCNAILDMQPTRSRGYATGFSLTSVQFFRFGRTSHGMLLLKRSGWFPLQISAKSPAWRTVAWMLTATPAEQGHTIPAVKAGTEVGSQIIQKATLIQQGSGMHNRLVYTCTCSDGQPAILKLGDPLSAREVCSCLAAEALPITV